MTYVNYDYAWKTPGWSVQNASYPEDGSGSYNNPGLPDDISLVKVFGRFVELETGRPLSGVITIRTSTMLTHGPTGTQMVPGIQRVRFRHGEFALFLPATDDPELTPPFLYQARLTVAGFTREFQFGLSVSETEVNILDLVPPPNGSIDLSPGADDGISLGAVPADLKVNITTGADFYSTISLDSGVEWAAEDIVRLYIGTGADELIWQATLTGGTAVFSVDKAVTDPIPDGTPARLVVTNGADDDVWGVGKVIKHG